MNIVNPYRFGNDIDAFKFKVTVANGENIPLPLEVTGTYNFIVNYGDGGGNKTVTAYNDTDAANTYTTAGTYEISINGTCTLFKVDDDANIDTNIVEVTQWGNIGLTILNFYGCTNLTITATDDLDTSIITSFVNLFRGCTSLSNVPNIESWNTSSVTNMSFAFSNADAFNQNLNTSGNIWDVSNVTLFTSMFSLTAIFNGTLTGWVTSSATNMASMFQSALAFNRTVNHFDVADVTTFFSMFQGASVYNQSMSSWTLKNTGTITCQQMFRDATAFNGDVTTWNTGKVTNMVEMFRNCDAFNRNLNTSGATWDVSAVTAFNGMFQDTAIFNGTLTGWVTTAATNMSGMFNNADGFAQNVEHFDMVGVTNISFMFQLCTYNQPLAGWNTSTIQNMSSLFDNNTSFNQALNGWDVSAVTNMQEMFDSADAFNQPLNLWNTGSVTNMTGMFYATALFNQDISDWDVADVTVMTDVNSGSITTTNYDLLLIDWSAQVLTSGVNFSIGTTKYTASNVDSGTTDGATTAFKLIQSGQNFNTTVTVGDVVRRSSTQYAFVNAIDSDTQLTLSHDIMVTGVAYTIEGSAAAKGRASMLLNDLWTITDGGPV